jgi:aspartate/tyrosine/aromatic aminotransferase
MPALGMAIKGRSVAEAMHSMAVSTVAGPTLQLQPIASAPHSVNFAAAVSGEEPSRQMASSSTVTITSTGSSGATDLAARMACSASFNAETVSISSISTPPSARPRICSA